MKQQSDKTEDAKEIANQREIPQTDMIKSVIDMYARSFRLPSKPDCKELDEVLNIKPGELVDKDLRTCETYLWALSQWTLWMRREVNLRKAYYAFDVRRPLKRMQGHESLKVSGRSRFEKLARVSLDPGMAKAQSQADVAEIYALSLDGFLDEANELKQALKRIIDTKQKEYEAVLRAGPRGIPER